MFGVSLLGRFCSYTDDPLRSGFHVESVFYYFNGHLHKIDDSFHEFLNVFKAILLSFLHDYNKFEPSHISLIVFMHVMWSTVTNK